MEKFRSYIETLKAENKDLRRLVEAAYYEGFLDGAAYSGKHSMFDLWPRSESYGKLNGE